MGYSMAGFSLSQIAFFALSAFVVVAFLLLVARTINPD